MKRISILIAAGLIAVAGCTDFLKEVKSQTAVVDTHLVTAQTQVAAADEKVVAVSTQPSMPAEAKTTLASAHNDLAGADKNIAAARGVLPKINANAQKLQDQRDAERNHWIGYKGRVALWGLAGVLFVFVVAGFILSGGNFELLGAVVSFIWGIVRPVLVAIGHMLTLGLVALSAHMKSFRETKGNTGAVGGLSSTTGGESSTSSTSVVGG